MNTRSKGTRMERLCLEEFKYWIKIRKPLLSFSKEWRSVANKFNNTDLFGDWDLALLYHILLKSNIYYEGGEYAYDARQKRERLVPIEFRIQVKSKYIGTLHRDLAKLYENGSIECYLAVYGTIPEKIKRLTIRLPHFWLIRVA